MAEINNSNRENDSEHREPGITEKLPNVLGSLLSKERWVSWVDVPQRYKVLSYTTGNVRISLVHKGTSALFSSIKSGSLNYRLR